MIEHNWRWRQEDTIQRKNGKHEKNLRNDVVEYVKLLCYVPICKSIF